jgi:hypothetical protein
LKVPGAPPVGEPTQSDVQFSVGEAQDAPKTDPAKNGHFEGSCTNVPTVARLLASALQAWLEEPDPKKLRRALLVALAALEEP